MRVTGYSVSVLGSRQENQDAFLVDNERQIYAVADGIGGGERGEVASLMAVTGVGAHPDESRLRETVETIQKAVLKESMETLGEARMGTTLTAVRVRDGSVELCHVGDSRCYKYSNGVLQQMTTDHETYDEGYGGPVLSSYLGIPTDTFPFQVQDENFPVAPGDRLLICSDGLYKQIQENDLIAIIEAERANPAQMLKTLSDKAATADYSDNITVVFVEIEA